MSQSPGRGGFRGRGGATPSRSPYRGRGSFGSPNRGRGGGYSPAPFSDKPMPESSSHDVLVKQKLDHGKTGRSVKLISNFFKFTTSEDTAVFHYDVDIKKEKHNGNENDAKNGTDQDGGSSNSTEKTSSADTSQSSETSGSEEANTNMDRFIKKFSPQIVERYIKDHPAIFESVRHVYDGFKNLYTVKKLDFGNQKPQHLATVRINVDGRLSEFEVKLRLVKKLELNEVLDYYSGKGHNISERTISVYEIILRSIIGQKYSQFQRKFFDLATAESSPRVQLAQFVQGFTSAIVPTEFGLTANIHLKTSCIISKEFVKLVDLAAIISNIKPGVKPSRSQILDVNRVIRHLKMYTEHSSRRITYTMDGLIEKTPSTMTFNRNGQSITIASYFETEYDKKLLEWPLMKTSGKQPRYIPLELCLLEQSQFLSNAKINSAIQRELLLKSTNVPNVYFDKLNSIAEKISGTDPELQSQFGISIDKKPVSFEGRVLPTPNQLCRHNRDKFYSTKEAPKWALFCFDDQIKLDDLARFAAQIIEQAGHFGLAFGSPKPVSIVKVVDSNSIYNAFFNLQSKTQAEFVFVGIPSHHSEISPSRIYGLVKFYCDSKFGIMSQCFNTEKMLRMPGGYFDNFLLKVNGKIGGLNAVIDPMQLESLPFVMAKTMMIGLDVNHPSESERIASSISVAVGSLDPLYSKYTASIRVQKKERDEIVKDLDNMIMELLEEFFKENNTYPENLIIFRDGISEGQFEMIKQTEMPLIEKGITKVGKTMSVKITVIVTMKHHNTRFALTQCNIDGRRPTWNVPSGTVVDNTIVEPKYKMFYLNSHFSPLGTSRPTKYVILRDDLNMNADHIQRMTFLACFNSIRTRGILAIPTPIRYADLCAYRSKLHIEAQRDIVDTTIRSDKSDLVAIEAEIIKRLNELVKVNPVIKNHLYYC